MEALARSDGAIEIDEELRFTLEQVLDEVRTVLADTARFLAANGDAGEPRGRYGGTGPRSPSAEERAARSAR